MIVFVHGVPETSAIWRKVQTAIGRPSVAVELPGFSGPRPDGFAATKDAYVDWLIGELEATEGPIDLVGHDWGAALVYRVASVRSDLIRSWAADVAGLAHPDYEWHDFAKLWQTPGDGEAFFAAQQASTPEEQASLLAPMGMAPDDGLAIAESSHDDMGACILDLYRSAMPNVHADWGPWAPTAAPGLVLYPTADVFGGDPGKSQEVADALGATMVALEGAGHFWPSETPDAGADALMAFWSQLA